MPDYGIYAKEDWPNPEKGFAAMITLMDHDTGLILDKLKKLGIDKKTLVVFTSDNGPHNEGGHKVGKPDDPTKGEASANRKNSFGKRINPTGFGEECAHQTPRATVSAR